ncbi:hypothetical protein San01_38640 [Streptomyces angustmyceticus]|uniref:Uncharacterized protein n=1 Tax=Streptomyces angustmyceticus TaxID=285578 RepID=A0A5J4LAL8_9ACTN|nr:hypothetical protein San01_38640 [Streptomyces angustmyceticus]
MSVRPGGRTARARPRSDPPRGKTVAWPAPWRGITRVTGTDRELPGAAA